MNGESKLYFRVGSYKLHRLLVKMLNNIFIAHGLHTLPKSVIFFYSLIENLRDYNSFVQSEVKMIVLHSGGQPVASNR